MRLNIAAFSVSAALVWGVGLFLMTWWIIAVEGVQSEPTLLGSVYIGYGLTPMGSVAGLVWGLIDGLVCGAIFAALYNWFAGRLG